MSGVALRCAYSGGGRGGFLWGLENCAQKLTSKLPILELSFVGSIFLWVR